ncbi:hypothetical protein [uncultured Chitinophaga sp.]|jgi:hypothetical protein|uniref:hypothetical protein n=1 Tax=uncultured Chitinophaga sp. TaxID=339340 RepID=UPI0026315291|nr:hypothetical protein [uncultured Chitinophaga sp.]
MQRQLLSLLTVAVLSGMWCACESGSNSPSYSCSGYTMHLAFQDSSGIDLDISNNTLFRTTADTGNYKHLATEALIDSFKLIINLLDGPYHNDAIWDDSLPEKVYYYSKTNRGVNQGLVLAGIREGTTIKYFETDTSCVLLTKWDPQKLTMTGTYYFEANNHTVKGTGTFTDVCFVSLK